MEFKSENIGYSSGPARFPPKNWLVESILVTVFCCLPLGIVGIIYAASVESKYANGDTEGARSAAQTAKTMVLISAILGLLGALIYILFFGGLVLFGLATEQNF